MFRVGNCKPFKEVDIGTLFKFPDGVMVYIKTDPAVDPQRFNLPVNSVRVASLSETLEAAKGSLHHFSDPTLVLEVRIIH